MAVSHMSHMLSLCKLCDSIDVSLSCLSVSSNMLTVSLPDRYNYYLMHHTENYCNDTDSPLSDTPLICTVENV